MDGLVLCPANYVPLSPISFLERAATVYGDKTSIVYGSYVRFSWKDTFARCLKLASALVQLKIFPGDVVSLALHTLLYMHSCRKYFLLNELMSSPKVQPNGLRDASELEKPLNFFSLPILCV
ncbi:hypothetical protein POTOM_028269 [Populus tomentosa]|uniref:AMP-dependent synthetase/ligase domain-containing protein n=1 Tax=Populus tomentosa TaxID=118781 RepID=A0A8X8CUP6_POPTO|nr:hypothetical protein POTOM_028269 [Populus tomentosa]